MPPVKPKMKRDVDFSKIHLRKQSSSKYDAVFDKLKVGESFVIDAAERNAWQIAKTRYETRTGKTLTIRKVKLNEGGGELRCGRVS